MEKEHATKCASHTHKYYGDQRNLPYGDEMLPCDCDSYHTFDELYAHRIALWQALLDAQDKINEEWGTDDNVIWKSKVHSDGTSFDGWFISGFREIKGEQITYHLPLSEWDNTCGKVLDKAPEWDGHTSDDVLERIKNL